MVSGAKALVDRQFSAQAQIKEMEKIYEGALNLDSELGSTD
jgi:hypothetical protein